MKILTWNLANYDDHSHWEIRRELIIKEIAKYQPDVLALQEVRYNPEHPSTKESHLNMAEQILVELQKMSLYLDARIVTQPAMYYSFPNWWEGISIITNLEAIETGNIFHILVENSHDRNKRVTQYAVLTDQDFVFTLFNTHFSYEELGMRLNVGETIDYMSRFAAYPSLLVGDLNAEPENENIQKFVLEGYSDTWQKLHPNEKGHTYKSHDPVKRIDFCWANEFIKEAIQAIEIIGNKPDGNGIFPSDHLGLLIEITE
jgi:endonuclease/exonuclease/phosphatase family metal-dependent hydrolase